MAKAKKASKSVKSAKNSHAKKTKKPVRGKIGKALSSAAKQRKHKISAGQKLKPGKKRILNDAKIMKLQKKYRSRKHSAASLCEEFGISIATLFNYLKIKLA